MLLMKQQPNPFSMLFTFVLLLLTPGLATALFSTEVTEIPYQINNSDRIVIGTVSKIDACDYYTNNTITVKEWLYNPLPETTIIVRTNVGTNASQEDEAQFTQNESVLLMLMDQRPDEGIFRTFLGFPGKHPLSDRDVVIKELKAQGKWKGGDQIGNTSNNTGNENDIPQSLQLTFGPETFEKLRNNPDFIAAYGKIPNFTTSEEKKQWLSTLDEVYHMAIPEMSVPKYPNDLIISYGYTIDGVLEVGINRNRTVDKTFMDGIYQIFDLKANQIGVKEIPVVFMYVDMPVPTIIMEPVVRTTNSATSKDKNAVGLDNSSGKKSSKTHSVPDFELFGSLTSLYCVWKLRKK